MSATSETAGKYSLMKKRLRRQLVRVSRYHSGTAGKYSLMKKRLRLKMISLRAIIRIAGKYSLMKKRLRQKRVSQEPPNTLPAGKYSLMKKRLRRKPSMFVEHPYCRRKVFADEEAIETRPAP